MNPIFEAYFQSDLFGKLIFIALFGLSILTWILFFQKWLIQLEIKKKGLRFHEIFKEKGQHPLTLDVSFSPQHPFAQVYLALKQQTIDILNKNREIKAEQEKVSLCRADIEMIQNALQSHIAESVKILEKNLFILSTIVSLAPFLGLLGTVWGILVTFSQLQHGAAGGAHSLVMHGLAMALGTTIVGLLVAIPALIAYNYLKSMVGYFGQEVENFSDRLVTSIELFYRR